MVVGSDGARSTVRQGSANLPFEGHDGTFRGIVVDAYLECPFAEGHGGNDNEHGWARAFAFGPGITRFNLRAREASATSPRTSPSQLTKSRRACAISSGPTMASPTFRWASRFDDSMRCVPALRQGNIFLGGRVARIHYPASGVGMNFCIQDAFNLGWKLAAVINGHAEPSLLDSYDAERMPVIRDLLASVKSQVAMQFNFSSEGVALKRHFEKEHLSQPGLNRKIGTRAQRHRPPLRGTRRLPCAHGLPHP